MQKLTISIAMTTFNGSRFLKEQLESLTRQETLPLELVIGDDGSTDDTINIIKKFSETAPFPVKIQINVERLNFSENFIKTALRCKGDWIAFCDQDDVWLPNKLTDALQNIIKFPRSVLILQNAYLSDETACVKGRLFPNKAKEGSYPAHSQPCFWIWPGFLQTVRRDLIHCHDFSIRPRHHFNYLGFDFSSKMLKTHDAWTCMLANAIGDITIINRQAAYYRRHNLAVTTVLGHETLREKIDNSKKISKKLYTFLSLIANETAEYMDYLKRNTNKVDWEKSFKHSAIKFRQVSQIQEFRSKIYNSNSPLERIRYFFKIFIENGYLGSGFKRMGLLSLIKDFYQVIFGR